MAECSTSRTSRPILSPATAWANTALWWPPKSLDFADAVRLVRKRGQYMQEAVPVGVGAMAALLKLPDGKLDSILAEASQGEVVTAANHNSPDQVVIAGHAGAVNRAVELAKAAGARRALLLPVSAPFHCPLMEPAQQRLKADLDATEFRDLAVPLVNGWQARGDSHRRRSARGSCTSRCPTRSDGREVIQKLASLGVGRFIEVGAGGVLTGLLRNIDSQLGRLQVRRSGRSGESTCGNCLDVVAWFSRRYRFFV